MVQLLATEVSFERAEAYNIKLLLHTFYETPCARSFWTDCVNQQIGHIAH